METLIGLVGGAIAATAIQYFRKLGVTLFVKNYGSLIEKTYSVLDPIASQLISSYDESEVKEAVKMIVTRVADSELDEKDVVEVTNYVIAKFNPSLAAAKVLDAESEEGKAGLEILSAVKSMHDGVSLDELFAVVRAAKTLL